jgi:serine-type D-Ala-D-Ala carboxypeptidase (penicillin-binding protein 5/6)
VTTSLRTVADSARMIRTDTRPVPPPRVPAPARRRRVAYRRRTRLRMATLLLLGTVIGLGCVAVTWRQTDVPELQVDWPSQGQAAVTTTDSAHLAASPRQEPVPIASVAKLMTAYVVLRHLPLHPGEPGPVIRLTEQDVSETAMRRARQESVVPVVAGERLTELQALQALLLPSANNIAVALARRVDGSVPAFVRDMNAAADDLGMTDTHYTDPSGYDDGTVSTAADQVRLVEAALRDPVLADIVGTHEVQLPVAGIVHNTDTLLGTDGFVGVKTGSHDAAGGCFAFRAVRTVDGRRTTITGVVLGQRGTNLIGAALAEAQRLVDQLAEPVTATR